MKDSYSNYMNQLKGEYKTVFTDIETYGWTVEIDSILFEEKMSELLDVFISAQEGERGIETIIGDDVNTFCQNFFAEIPRISMVREFFDSIKRMAWFLLVIDIIDILMNLGNEEEAVSDLSSIIFLFFSSYVLSRILEMVGRKLLYKKVRMNAKARRILLVSMELVLIVVLVAVSMNFTDGLLNIPSTVEAAVLAIYLVIYYIANHRRLREDKEVRTKGTFYEEVADEMERPMQKKFDKKNARNLKKGEAPFTWEEFVEKENKETEKSYRFTRVYLFVLPLVILVAFLAFLIPTGNFESLEDGLFFSGVVLVVEYILMYLIYLMNRSVYRARRRWGENQLSILALQKEEAGKKDEDLLL